MQWIILLLAGIAEVVWATLMKISNGFTVIAPSIGTVIFYILSAVFLSLALKKLPLGTAYAMWTGFGIIGTTVLGVLLFHETISPTKIICIALIVSGIVGLKLI